ncbi:hypothetical protein RUND412_010315, partial [Rhizina undulata]
MSDNTEQRRKRKLQSKWTTSYCNIVLDTEEILGFTLDSLKVILAKSKLAKAQHGFYGPDAGAIPKMKETMYNNK